MRWTWTIAIMTLCVAGSPALALDSNSAPIPSGAATMADDQSGAIRSLGSADDNERGKGTVTVPQLGTDTPSRTGGAPRGTATGSR